MSGALGNSAAEIVRQLVVDLGHGTDPADDSSWPAFHSSFPNDPDNAIGVTDSGTELQASRMSDGEQNERKTVQIKVRASGDNAAHIKVDNICQGLDKDVRLTSVTIGSNVYLVDDASRISGPMSVGKDKGGKGRRIFSANYSLVISQTT